MLEQMRRFLEQAEERAKHWQEEWVRLEAEEKKAERATRNASGLCNKWRSIVDDLRSVLEQAENSSC